MIRERAIVKNDIETEYLCLLKGSIGNIWVTNNKVDLITVEFEDQSWILREKDIERISELEEEIIKDEKR